MGIVCAWYFALGEACKEARNVGKGSGFWVVRPNGRRERIPEGSFHLIQVMASERFMKRAKASQAWQEICNS